MFIKALPAATLVLSTLLMVPGNATAQDLDPIPVPVGEVSVGYTFLRDFSDFPGDMNFPAGWYAGGGVNLNRWFGIAGEVGGSYKNDFRVNFPGMGDAPNRSLYESFTTDVRVYTAMAGPRFFFKSGRILPFAQVLAGGIRLNTETNFLQPVQGVNSYTSRDNYFALQPGGGVTMFLTDRVGIRLQADHRLIVDFDEDGNQYDNEFRAAAGLVFGWGHR